MANILSGSDVIVQSIDITWICFVDLPLFQLCNWLKRLFVFLFIYLFILSTGSPQEHLWSLLAHDLGAKDQSSHHAQQSHRERLGECRVQQIQITLSGMTSVIWLCAPTHRNLQKYQIDHRKTCQEIDCFILSHTHTRTLTCLLVVWNNLSTF